MPPDPATGPKLIGCLSLKGGVGKTCLSVNLAGWLATERHHSVGLLDGDRNKGASLYVERGGPLPFPVLPIARFRTALAQASDFLFIDGQASPDLAELKELASDCDAVLLPTTGHKVSLLLTIEAAEVMRELGTPFRVVLTRCDGRQRAAVESAAAFLKAEGLPLLEARTTLLSAYEQAEAAGTLVGLATTDRGQRNPRAADAWAEIGAIATEFTNGI
jgi:chromosome partitioning protein